MPFVPLERKREIVQLSKRESDKTFFFDLIEYGEYLTKLLTLFVTACIDEDKENTRYRHEYNIAHAGGIGDFAKEIDAMVVGPASSILTSYLRDHELKELTQRVAIGTWQYDAFRYLNEIFEILHITHEPTPRLVPLRAWFGAFARLRNKTKGHGSVAIESCNQTAPRLEKSINLIVDNCSAFKRPWVYLHQSLSGRYRISPLNDVEGVDRYFIGNPSTNYANGVYSVVDKPRRIRLFYSDSELTDFFVPNGGFQEHHFETISYLSGVQQKVEARDYLRPVTVPSSITKGLDNLEALGNCFNNVPQPADDYVNRIELEEELRKVIREEDRYPIITLVGRGGIGKTSLAIKVIREIAETNRFDLIIWFSARDVDLLMEGPKQVKTEVLNKKDISVLYCKLIGVGDIKDKITFFSEQLAKNEIGKALYVFDNFETLTNPLEIFEWLSACVRNPNKVLITSRVSRNFKADYPIEVKGMTERECRLLIDIFSKKLAITSILTKEYIEQLIEESSRHPYIIKILLGEVAKQHKVTKVERIVADQEAILTALFKRTYNGLTPAAKRVFLIVCSWNSLISVFALESVLLRPEIKERLEVQDAVDELEKSSFINVTPDPESEDETYISVPLAAAIFGRGELKVFPGKAEVEEDKKLLVEFGATTESQLHGAAGRGIRRKFQEVAKRLDNAMEFRREKASLEHIARNNPLAWKYLVEITEDLHEYEMAKEYLREHLKLSISSRERVEDLRQLADLCKRTHDWKGENSALQDLVTLTDVPFFEISRAASRINQYIYDNPGMLKPRTLISIVAKVMTDLIGENGNATDYSKLAWLLLHLGEEPKARRIVMKGLEIDPFNTHCQKLYDRLTTPYR